MILSNSVGLVATDPVSLALSIPAGLLSAVSGGCLGATMSAHSLSLPEMRTEATRLLASGSEHLEDGNYTHAAADLGAASELFAKVIIAIARFLIMLVASGLWGNWGGMRGSLLAVRQVLAQRLNHGE